MKKRHLLTLSLITTGLWGCGNTHLDCDTEENIELLESSIILILNEQIKFGLKKRGEYYAQDDSFPNITVRSFNQKNVDDDAKSCSYEIDAEFPIVETTFSEIPITLVFRNVERGEDTHEIEDIDMSQQDLLNMGIAGIKSELSITQNRN